MKRRKKLTVCFCFFLRTREVIDKQPSIDTVTANERRGNEWRLDVFLDVPQNLTKENVPPIVLLVAL